MPNLFLGFPVARAKIADMISTAAPPLDHHTNHENGGDDEIDATGLEGAGAGLGFDDFIYETFFEGIDGFSIEKSATEVVEAEHIQLKIDTLSSAGSYVTFYKHLERDNPIMTWEKDRRLRFKIWANSATNELGQIGMVLGYKPNTDYHLGFYILDGVLYGSCANGTTHTTVPLQTIGTGSWTVHERLEIYLHAALRADFYINDVLSGTIDTVALLPRGTSSADALIGLDLRNGANAKQLRLRVSQWKFWQAA